MRATGSSVRAGRYEIRAHLGRGAFREVYHAWDRSEGREVALKELDLAWAESWKAVELFEREAKILASLSHPAIPKVLDAFTEDDGVRFFLVEEKVDGTSLERRLAEAWTPTLDEVKAIARQLLDVLQYLEERAPPVVHRDIKPANLILGTAGRLMLVDFGAVREVLTDQSRQGSTTIGTVGFMAPEQLQGRATPAIDRYGLGATLVNLLCRTPPHRLPPNGLRPDFRPFAELPAPFAAWLDRLLSPLPEDRWSSARSALAQLAACDDPKELSRARDIERSLARPPPEGSKLRAWQRGSQLVIDAPGDLRWLSGLFAVSLLISGLVLPFFFDGFWPLALFVYFVWSFVPTYSGAHSTLGSGRLRIEVGPEQLSVRDDSLRRNRGGSLGAVRRVRVEHSSYGRAGRVPGKIILEVDGPKTVHELGHAFSDAELDWIAAEIRAHLGLDPAP